MTMVLAAAAIGLEAVFIVLLRLATISLLGDVNGLQFARSRCGMRARYMQRAGQVSVSRSRTRKPIVVLYPTF